MIGLTVGELKKLIAEVPDDLPVLREGSDHSYCTVDGASDLAVGYMKPESRWDPAWFEWYGEEHANEGEEKKYALVIY